PFHDPKTTWTISLNHSPTASSSVGFSATSGRRSLLNTRRARAPRSWSIAASNPVGIKLLRCLILFSQSGQERLNGLEKSGTLYASLTERLSVLTLGGSFFIESASHPLPSR